MVKMCPVCNVGGIISKSGPGGIRIDCSRCGIFRLTSEALDDLGGHIRQKQEERINRTLISHFIQKRQNKETSPLLKNEDIERIIEFEKLPNTQEQAYSLIRFLGENSSEPGIPKLISSDEHGALIGSTEQTGFDFIVDSLKEQRLIYEQGAYASGRRSLLLSFEGWSKYEELIKGRIHSNKAFMAMPYGDQVLDNLVDNYFREAVDQTGFKLERLDDNPVAGLIDDRLRVDIQISRFLISDLTGDNNGAYWEAGYAEGLGKPVIYTCEKSHWEKIGKDKGKGPHFDTNHHLTVIWSEDEPNEAAQKLKNTIRATMLDAKMTDD